MAGKKRRKQKAVPKGDEFMKGIPTEDIRTAYRKEKTVKAVAILLACLARRNGGGGAAIVCTQVGDPSRHKIASRLAKSCLGSSGT